MPRVAVSPRIILQASGQTQRLLGFNGLPAAASDSKGRFYSQTMPVKRWAFEL
jgi:hypothetical protein